MLLRKGLKVALLKKLRRFVPVIAGRDLRLTGRGEASTGWKTGFWSACCT